MSAAQPRKSRKEIEAILANIRFLDRKFLLLDKSDGFLLQLSYEEADIDTNELKKQKSRKYYVSPYMTETEIVDTAFFCVMRSQEHVTREHFLYKGYRVQSPHFSIGGRLDLCTMKQFDRREDLK